MHLNLLLPDEKKIVLLNEVCHKDLHIHSFVFPLCGQHILGVFAAISFCF